MELVQQLAMLQKPATFLLVDGTLAGTLYLSGKAMVKALNAARATGCAVLSYMASGTEGMAHKDVVRKIEGMLGELNVFVSLHSLHKDEILIETQNNLEGEDEEIPGIIIGSIKIICADHLSQAFKSAKKPRR